MISRRKAVTTEMVWMDQDLTSRTYAALRELAEKMAEGQREPAFYRDCREEMRLSTTLLKQRRILKTCPESAGKMDAVGGHGIYHSRTVAVEAGVIVMVEGDREGMGRKEVDHLVHLAHIAGLLHDVRRGDRRHEEKGAAVAGDLMRGMGMSQDDAACVATAIRNHVAFREAEVSRYSHHNLVSDALYDADKFRWGPDNFTRTLWQMVEAAEVPLPDLYNRFQRGMYAIRSIRRSFRSETGKRYGPEFIDLGLEIGNRIYLEMGQVLQKD